MMCTIDARGLACPAPVLLAKDMVEKEAPQELTVMVDNPASSENVIRFLTTRNYLVTVQQQDGVFQVIARHKDGGGAAAADPVVQQATGSPDARLKVLVLVASAQLGRGDDGLGDKLMISYLKTLKELGEDLWQLIFLNSGVRLTIESSPVLSELREYEKNGVIILACGTCLEHFQLTELKKVGTTTNMLDIVTAMQLADKVISLG